MDRKVQNDELDVLKSIFYDDELQVIEHTHEKDIKLIVWVYPVISKDYPVKYKESLESSEHSFITVNYLPPIQLYLKLPEGYPSARSPIFNISCPWLTKEDTVKLCLELDKIWSDNENTEIIYLWADFLKNEAIKLLGYEAALDLTLLYSCHLQYRKQKELEYLERQNASEQGPAHREDNACGSHNSGASSAGIEKGRGKERVSPGSHISKGKRLTLKSTWGCSSKSRFLQGSGPDINSHYDRRPIYLSNKKTSPLKLLVNYNSEREEMEFEKVTFLCKICFSDHSGRNCLKFEKCGHVFCKDCMKSYFDMKINDGIQPIKCPESECKSDATLAQIKDLVSEEIFARYDALLLQSALDSLDHIVYCPRSKCQYPATRDKEENLAICPYCQYVFCIFCRMVYHGIEPCKLNSDEKKKLVEKYLGASKEEQDQMELRYGKRQIQSLVNNTLAETWIENNCKNCPKCNVSIEKSEGCNKMICWKCNTYFCWLCSEELDRTNPYSHFNDANSRCANKLFYLTPLADDDLDEYNSDDEQWRDWDWI